MEEKNCINAGRPVYFSYARNSQRKPEWEHISDCMDKLLEVFEEKNIEYRLDKRDIGTGDKISTFENEIGWKSEVVVIVFSDKYFRSMHCMYEFVQIKRALEQYPEKRLMCIKSGDFNLADINYIMELEQYWNNQKIEYEKIEYHRLREHSGTEKAAWQNGFYLDDIRKLYSFFSAINYSYAQSIDYDSFTNDIVKYYKKTPKPKLTPKVKSMEKTKEKPRVEPKPETKTQPHQPRTFVYINTPQMSPVYYQTNTPDDYTFVDDYKQELSIFTIIKKCFQLVWFLALLCGAAVLAKVGFEEFSKYISYSGYDVEKGLSFTLMSAPLLIIIFLVKRIIRIIKELKQ